VSLTDVRVLGLLLPMGRTLRLPLTWTKDVELPAGRAPAVGCGYRGGQDPASRMTSRPSQARERQEATF
jgi:hypothetical protein